MAQAGQCYTVIDVMKEITSAHIRRRYMGLFATQDKTHHSMGGRLNLSGGGICAASCGNSPEVHLMLHEIGVPSISREARFTG